MSDKLSMETTNYEPPKVVLGNLPNDLMQETLDIVNKYGCTSTGMGLLRKASRIADKLYEAMRLIVELKDDQKKHIFYIENPHPDLQKIRPTKKV